jgi:hypothetical protein
MAGTITAASLDSGASATAPLFKANGTEIGTLCRAWVNFNGTGTVAIRGSFNVSSITDNGTGDYTVNFTTAMPDANYSTNLSSSREPTTGSGGFCQNIATNDATGGFVSPTTTAIRVAINGGNGLGGRDVALISVAVFR